MKKIFVSPDKRFWLDEGINKVLARIEHMAFSKIWFVVKILLIFAVLFAVLYLFGNYIQSGVDPVPPVPGD